MFVRLQEPQLSVLTSLCRIDVIVPREISPQVYICYDPTLEEHRY